MNIIIVIVIVIGSVGCDWFDDVLDIFSVPCVLKVFVMWQSCRRLRLSLAALYRLLIGVTAAADSEGPRCSSSALQVFVHYSSVSWRVRVSV